ncbi:hypothetical protein EB796_004839 [Bugula neritina]|uniref:Caspase family p20 domain-containing protein n=1 Tax=Bugula neritina TaxID=10212 RepID=A0A7J7KF75_BUGNE|nr:hypothetical protein EB796_004839 [Bugula neritina]
MASNNTSLDDQGHHSTADPTLTSANTAAEEKGTNDDALRQLLVRYYKNSRKAQSEYEIKNKGLFVTIRNSSFRYIHDSFCWYTNDKLEYEKDEQILKETFNLDGSDQNLLLGQNLTCLKDTEPQNQFDVFIDNLLEEKPDEESYDFLLFILMSHGLENDKFFLAESEISPACCNSESREADHSYHGSCHLRDVKKDVVEKIQDSPKFRSIPKIFLIQTCRGDRMRVVTDSAEDIRRFSLSNKIRKMLDNKINPDKYIPIGSDTYIIHACIEDHSSWVEKEGSFLIQYFCEAVKELHTAMSQYKTFVGEFKRRMIDECESQRDTATPNSANIGEVYKYFDRKGWNKLVLCAESMTDGWIEGIAQKTIANITKILVIGDRGRMFDKQQPQIDCTLRYKFSMLKVLQTQWESLR